MNLFFIFCESGVSKRITNNRKTENLVNPGITHIWFDIIQNILLNFGEKAGESLTAVGKMVREEVSFLILEGEGKL